MISTKYASFFYGIVIASVTWAFSLYLYSRLSQNVDIANPTMFISDLPNPLKESTFDQRSRQRQDHNNYVNKMNKELIGGKEQYDLKPKKDYKNSEKLLQQLKPVPVKPAVTIGQGEFWIN